ncbi:HAD-IA family hydrolase [Pedomonas mirosovicensis]|uniref:HAD-IA family hydrolase n=1 Tax=Pedomonas mirosovicensis TaxID=2908641 RepID=UPI00216A626B|nr:HAD-IA family hydrolase [Pedomonas mirosovicensis]MCH8684709.1 HAD-IA family hydrolase [Pedomonas mirosovicensis]
METIPSAIEGTCALVEELAARGVPLFAITNFSAEFFPRFCADYPIMRHFRDIVVSGVEKVMKPNPRIYEIALGRFGLKPGEGMFIDDRLDNVQASAAAGFVPHHFRSPELLRAELEAAGLL